MAIHDASRQSKFVIAEENVSVAILRLVVFAAGEISCPSVLACLRARCASTVMGVICQIARQPAQQPTAGATCPISDWPKRATHGPQRARQAFSQGHVPDRGDADISRRPGGGTLVCRDPLAGQGAAAALRVGRCPGRNRPREHALSLPHVPQAVLGSGRHGDGKLEARLSGAGAGGMPDDDRPESTVEQEAAPRSRRHAEDGLASGAPHPENRAKNAGGLFPGPVAADGPMQAASGGTCGCPVGGSRRDGGRRARPRSSARRGGSATPFPRTLFPMPARKRFRASRPAMRPGCDRPCRRRGVQEHAVSGMRRSAIRSANV